MIPPRGFDRLLLTFAAAAALACCLAQVPVSCSAQSIDDLYLSALEAEEAAETASGYRKAAAIYERIVTQYIPEENEEIFGCALFSLATILSDKLGDPDGGRVHLQRIVKELPDSSWSQRARETLSGGAARGFDSSGLGIGISGSPRKPGRSDGALRVSEGRLVYRSGDAGFTMDLPADGWVACEGGLGTPLEETLRVIVFLPGNPSKVPPALSVLSYGSGFAAVDAFAEAISGDLGLQEDGARVSSRSGVDLDGDKGIFISLRSPVDGEQVVQEWLLTVCEGRAYAVGSTASAEDFRTIGKEMRRGLMSFRPSGGR